MQSFSCKVFALAVPLILGLLTLASAQSPVSTSDWETLRPEGEEFSVLIPKGSKFESSKEPYHKMELNTRFYISNTQGGPVFAVVSLSGIKSNPAMYTEMERVNSYVDAFKNFFPPKLRTKPVPVKLTLVGAKNLQGNAGREYALTIGELSGTVQAFATRKRFYALVYLNSKKDKAIEDQFVSSFVLPEWVAPPPVVAVQNPPATPPNRQNQPAAVEAQNSEAAANQPPDAKLSGQDPAAPRPTKRRAISGGVLNGKAISLPQPEYPAEAKAAGAAGSVAVQVTIDEQGTVVSAQAVSGHPTLQQSAVNAALQARFTPTSLMGEPVKVTGVIVYNFARP
ncbi:MAG: energy transducer TonB [Acidobacteriota bacterium]|nr:energy transducer TonB [Acidobacteriota bacterium]